jgi:tRNA A-37 threonylcarbamoyl transferase component Bud32
MVASSAGPSGIPSLFDGRYRLEEQIGRGGTAEVYRALDTKAGRAVALKRCLACDEPLSVRRRELLEREYYTLAQLEHPRIIEVYDYGVADTGAYYTMELLDGGDLSSGGQWPWQEACALLVDVASSLSILHSRGLLHRDVSARNVRRGRDNRAKLIDFGALSSIGTALDVVGTPPYVPPEALQMQVLDARADLFALGALGYYLLSGRHAFQARKLADLRDCWRSTPGQLHRLVPGLPQPLIELTMELLSLDRMARPASAADVMRRLCGIADLPIAEDLAVSRAYLTTPMLVGRDALQVTLRRSLLRVMNGDGETVLVEGQAGSGRTRALDACVLDGRMLGVQVVRADASLGASGDWGVARAICAQLLERLPRQAEAAALPLSPWLGPVLAELRNHANAPLAAARLERNARIRGMRDFVLALAHRDRLLIAVDDVDRIDEPSLAFLAALCGHVEGRGLLLAVTMENAGQSSREGVEAALRVLRARGKRIALQLLTLDQTDALLRSVFGGVPNASLLAPRVYALARGNPRDTMELAQHLVERGLARYEAGTWLLPSELSPNDLPQSMAGTLLARVSGLSSDARALAELTAVTELPGLTSAQYEALCEDWPPARLYRALQELIAARVLLSVGTQYSLCARAYATILLEAMTPERLRAIHARWARVLEHSGADAVLQATHLIAAGRPEAGIELLLSLDLGARQPRVELIRDALAYAVELKVAVRKQSELRLWLVTSAMYAMDLESFKLWAPRALGELVRDTGLAAYGELSTEQPERVRMREALALTQRRHAATPEALRGFTPLEAIVRLLRLTTAHAVMAMWAYDARLLDEFPSLTPLRSQSELVDIMTDLLEVARDWVAGRHKRVFTRLHTLLDTVRDAPLLGLDDGARAALTNTLHVLLGVQQAMHGVRESEQHARVLAAEVNFRANAWRVRQLFQLSQGNWLEASSCGRRAETIRLQQGGEPLSGSGIEAAELYSGVLLGDLLLVRQAIERVAGLAAQFPGWGPILLYGQAAYAALQNDWAEAKAFVEQALRLVQPGQHAVYTKLAGLHVHALSALGRHDQALELGALYQTRLEAEDVGPTLLLAAATGNALSSTGRHAEALARLEQAIAQAADLSMSGQLLGQLFETAAHVVLRGGDAARFEVLFTACALEYRKAQNPTLGQRLLRLFDAARAENIRVVQLAQLLDQVGVNMVLRVDQALLRDRFGECIDRADRAHCALSFVLAQAERASGYLFAVGEAGLTLLGGIPDDKSSTELCTWTKAWFETQAAHPPNDQIVTETMEGVTETVSESEAVTAQGGSGVVDDSRATAARLVTGDGREFEPILLASQQAPVGVIMLELSRGGRTMPTRGVLDEVVTLLTEYGDLPRVPVQSRS